MLSSFDSQVRRQALNRGFLVIFDPVNPAATIFLRGEIMPC